MKVSGFLVIVLLIVLVGVLGGLRNWFLDEPRSRSINRRFIGRLLDGVIASATVPLFLSVIGTEKIKPAFGLVRVWDADYQQALLILVGFCLLAAVFPQRFLDSMSLKFMQLKDKVEDVEDKVEQTNTLLETQVEDEEPNKPDQTDQPDELHLSVNSEKILKAMSSGQFLVRSRRGLIGSSGLAENEFDESLKDLISNGLVRTLTTRKGERWVLTEAGRSAALLIE